MIPFVSVIIPTYNYGRFLGEAIGSVLGQTFDNLECIVIDDGSSDETEHVLASFSDQRIVSTRTPRLGVSAARNHGLEMSRGTLIAFLDADDIPINWNGRLRYFPMNPMWIWYLQTLSVLHQRGNGCRINSPTFLNCTMFPPGRPSATGWSSKRTRSTSLWVLGKPQHGFRPCSFDDRPRGRFDFHPGFRSAKISITSFMSHGNPDALRICRTLRSKCAVTVETHTKRRMYRITWSVC